MFSQETYTSRRLKLKEAVGDGVLLLPGNGQSSMNYRDNWYPFRQDSSFFYYTGINQVPDLFLVIDIENDREILFGNDPTPEEKVWVGAVEPLRHLAHKSGIMEVQPMDGLQSFLRLQRKKKRHLHYLPPYRGETTLQLSLLLEVPCHQVNGGQSIPFIRAVAAQRSKKSQEEIKELNRAVDITAAMIRHAIKTAVPGKTERAVAGELQAIAIAQGGNISFPIILTRNGQYLHNHATEDVIQEGDIILCDCGAETDMVYSGDMTRTFPAGDRFLAAQKEVYDIVLRAHNDALLMLKPGVPFRDVHLFACTRIAEGLKEMGLMKGDPQEAVAAGAHTLFFPCGLGHLMGLDVHDMENLGEAYTGYTDTFTKSTAFGLRSLRLGKALEAGNVITVEPGIYFNPFLIDSWRSQKKYLDFVDYKEVEKFRDFGGIRIEEDLLITAEGSQLLGNPLAKTTKDIEALKI